MTKRKIGTICLLIIFLVLGFFIFNEQCRAADYYNGKVITIVVGYGPGGGYDRMARIISRHLPKHIPGNPTVMVQNMPGAATVVAANHIYNVAKPDGLTLGTFSRGLPFLQLTKEQGVNFDIRKFSWIGSAAVETMILVVRSDLPYKRFEDLLKVKEPIPVATVGPGSDDYQFVTLLKEFAGFNAKLIAYPSSSDMQLAVERKEVDCRSGSYSSLKPFIENGVIRPIVRGRIIEPGLENVQVNEDLASDPKGKTLMAMLGSSDRFGRPYVAPPGTPDEMVKILREAFAKMADDPEAKQDAEKNKMALVYTPGDECSKVLDYIFNQPDDIVKDFTKYMKK